MDVFVSIEEDYCLKGMHFAICRTGKHHSLYLKVSFSIFSLFQPDFGAIMWSLQTLPLV